MSLPSTLSPPLKVHAATPLQVANAPYRDEVDFGPLRSLPAANAALDPVSLADLLRNAFVYPPHSIYRDVKVSSLGFDPPVDAERDQFVFPYRQSPAPVRPAQPPAGMDVLLETYHRLLCEAVSRATPALRAPWMLQSAGKDSTSLAIALAESRPDTVCLTYLGGREENEVASAQAVAGQLGLRHETLVCDPGRAYDRYLALVPQMPLLTADFALLSCADLLGEVALRGGDGVVDGCGSDIYFGTPVDSSRRLMTALARRMPVPGGWLRAPGIGSSFPLCFGLATLGMDAFERYFPGSRFSDAEVDQLLGRPLAQASRARLDSFRVELQAAATAEGRRRVAMAITDTASFFAKGQYVAAALGLRQAYPHCDQALADWVYNHVPDDLLIDTDGHNKVLVRRYIERRLGQLPYVSAKGCFRFDLRGLARARFDQVHAFAVQARDIVPGAQAWLERHRRRMDNKFFASKLYLLAVTLPWLLDRFEPQSTRPSSKEVRV